MNMVVFYNSIYNDLVAMAPSLIQPATEDGDVPGS